MTDALFLPASVAAYTAAGMSYAAGLRARSAPSNRWVSGGLFLVGFLLTTYLIGSNWIALGHPPFKTLYESLLLLVWFTSILYIAVACVARSPVVGVGVSAILVFVLGVAMLNRDLDTTHLPPSLQSPWFLPHVLAYFAAYGLLLLGTVAAVVHLARSGGWVKVEEPAGERTIEVSRLMHLLVIAGYVLLSVGMVLGAIWAREAWGDYWSWDPKESWALISWLTYTLYFHLRRLPGWRDRGGAWVVVVGFAVVVFTYVGIRLLPTGDSSVHVYQ